MERIGLTFGVCYCAHPLYSHSSTVLQMFIPAQNLASRPENIHLMSNKNLITHIFGGYWGC